MMEFKKAIKTKIRMCVYYKSCKGCPFDGFPHGCIDGIFELENTDEYEKILEEWAKEHPFVTNADKFAEVMKNTFGEDLEKTEIRWSCVTRVRGIKCPHNCEKCLTWWDEEYKEPKKGKKQMNKFKVGDIVKVTGGFGPAKGKEGVVVEVDTGSARDGILCRFENFKGHKGNGLTRRGKDFDTDDHWYLLPHQIELISRPNETEEPGKEKE